MGKYTKARIIVLIVFILILCSISFIFGRCSMSEKTIYVEVPIKVETSEQLHIEEQEEIKVESEELSYRKIEVEATAYCPCEKCCGKTNGITATGTKATAGRTIAVDPKQIPYGTEVVIDGHTYVAEDCGGAIKGDHIDIFFDRHEDALAFGRKTLTAEIKGD